ncbi:unnamed protein product [Microthlaspi erraticum]|uniref:Uncharacterized protein n=1 Tax=Microthlaspi erraticum TaxID=1685480 RepID=A0A6D2KIR5_9BRAS|nr:unnamed protein product [Microthlaspi erraticum]
MDFIKTSSLRALIELTFQRNWNGLIWMSRKGVTTKRVKTVQTALSRTAPSAAAGRETNVSRSAKIVSVRLKSRPKFKPPADASRPGKQCPVVFWSILEHMGHEEHGGTWHMDAAQLDTQRKKGEAILKTSSTVYSTNRPSFNSIELRSQQSNPKNVASPLTFL